MKRISITLSIVCIAIITATIININKITKFLSKFFDSTPNVVVQDKNEYANGYNFEYVSTTDDFVPYGYQDLMNIIYTILDNGWTNFTFYCPKEYTNCIKDVQSLTNDQEKIGHINNFVSPFNSFNNIKTSMSEEGEINIEVSHLYTDDDIKKINAKIDQIIKDNITDDMSNYDKIKTIHDYLVNNSKYDVNKNEGKPSNHESFKATGPLFEGYATCNGYTDAMALFLNRFGIKNYKIGTTPEDKSLTGHVWNGVYLDGRWVHLDITWDDPVSESGTDYLYHKYLLVTNDELKKADEGKIVVTEHNFKKSIYSEFE